MNTNPRVETEEDIQIIKEFTLLPILLDMLARDIDELTMYRNKLVYNHVISYLRDIENSVYAEMQTVKRKLKAHDIKIIKTEMNGLGIDVEYKIRGYIHHFKMLRSLVKAELMTMLANLRRRLE
ncbi:hypothetical protein [Paenibacillus ehimensis]|uniref:Uncharacterized protein n=1 Tax=Paenibacillus ehimensis TaxID=79264 RepID=A0ABT8V9I2_9BACL|nr:hypothetical protein [Paenibacillus ehimensis]MDO3677629.1 hypothetical protein [Paenibacillus ehimensis]MEC0213104.1 hypothetical protein [Paenibacillus ehimensis]